MRVELTADPTAFRSPDWSELIRLDPGATFFHTPQYLKLWWEEFGSGDLLLASVREGSEAVARCAFEIAGGTLVFLGGSDVTDYMGPVGVPGAEDAAAKELLASLASEVPWDRADLRGLPSGSPWLGALQEAARSLGLRPREEDDGVAPLIALPRSFQEYLQALPSKLRHEIRRKQRRLAEQAGSYRVVISTPESVAEDYDRFLELHRASPGPKGRFMRPGMEIFFRRLGEEFLASHVFHLAFLELEGRRAAAAVGFAFKDGFSLYNSAFDRRYASLSPGMVLVAELISQAIDSGRKRFDMLKGDLEYKYRFGPVTWRVRRILLER